MAERPSSSSINCPIIRKKPATKQYLVRILITDSSLLNKWSQFCAELECPTQDKLKWERGIKNGTFQYYDVFSEMLDDWVERNSRKMTVDDLCRVLRGIECVAVAEKLESDFNKDEIIQQGNNSSTKRKLFVRTGKEIKWPLKHGLFVPTANFTGREEQLEEIQTSFNSKNNLMLITGFGGIGKTELCRKFAHKICKFVIFRVPSCVWLHGENLGTLRESVLKLAEELGITTEGNPPVSQYFECIVSFILENSKRLLLVIDNVDIIYPEVEKVIKIVKMAKNEKMFVIVTSRDKNVLDGAGITMQLEILSKLQARRMLTSSMSGLTDSDADKLCYLVEYFPLALQQAVAYIKQQKENFRTPNYSVTDYVNEFKVKKGEMLDQKLNKFEHNYSMTTLVTWDMTICKLSEGAIKILKIIAFLDPDGVKLDYFQMICTHMGVVDFDGGLDMLNSYCLVKIEDFYTRLYRKKREDNRIIGVDKGVSVHRLVQEVIRGRVDIDYPKTLFDTVFLVRWELFGDSILNYRFNFSDDVHLKSVYKFSWKCGMQEINYFGDALFFLLVLNRIDCAEKLTKLEFPYLEFSSEFGVEKREFFEKLLFWSFVCGDSSTNSEEIAKGEFNVHWKRVKHVFINFNLLETVEGCLKLSLKHFGEMSKITFLLKNQLVQKLSCMREFDKAFGLCEELATFPFQDDDNGQANLLCKTIEILWGLVDTRECCTPSRIATIDKIMNKIDLFHFSKNYPSDSVEWMKLEEHWCDLKGDYKKALELCTKIVENGNTDPSSRNRYKYKIIELKIKLTDFDSTTVEEFVREFGGVDFYCLTRRGLGQILAIYEANLGEGHELTINHKLRMALRLHNGNATDKDQCIELCEQILRSQFDGEYEWALFYLCRARGIEYGDDECRKILQNLLETKILELGIDHSNTEAILELLGKFGDVKCQIL